MQESAARRYPDLVAKYNCSKTCQLPHTGFLMEKSDLPICDTADDFMCVRSVTMHLGVEAGMIIHTYSPYL